MDDKERLARRIARLREDLGSETRPLSRDDLAHLLSKRLRRIPAIAGTTVMKWEKPASNGPDPWALLEMAKLAKVDVERFVYPPPEEIVLRAEREDPFAGGSDIPVPPRVEFTGDEDEQDEAKRRRR